MCLARPLVTVARCRVRVAASSASSSCLELSTICASESSANSSASMSVLVVSTPLVSPVVVNLGFDPVWFTVLFAVCLQTSFLTPPVGFAIFYLKGVAPEGVDVRTIYRGVAPFIVLQLIGLIIIFNWDALVTWLPAQAYGPR